MRNTSMACGLIVTALSTAAQGQLNWDLFEDPLSTSICDVVNTAGNELVVLSSTGQLMLVSSIDTVLQDTFVDDDNFVFFEGEPAGSIEFAEDADGFRTLWWLTFDGRVVDLDPFSLQPLVGNKFPDEFTNVPCDACELVDLPPAGVCDDVVSPPISIDICGLGVGSNAFLAMTLCGFVGLRSISRR